MDTNGWIGGRHLSQREREPYVAKLRTLPVIHAHWPNQDRCGFYGEVQYRGRRYCPNCGHRKAVPIETFMEQTNHRCPSDCKPIPFEKAYGDKRSKFD